MDQPVAAEIVNLHKTFKTGLGKPVVHAVRGIDMNIRQGEVYGLIGPNGSGKSTLMKALLGLVRPTEGSCSIFGRSSLAPDSKEEVGFLPENPYFYKFLTGAETVSFYGRLCGLSGKSLKAKVRELLELVGLADAADRRLGGYSKGMLQRIGMAQALVQSPRLLVLDEPTARRGSSGVEGYPEHYRKPERAWDDRIPVFPPAGTGAGGLRPGGRHF